jgi:hypothetical protein
MLEIGASIARLQGDMSKAQRTVDGFAKSAKTAFAAIGGYLAGTQMVSALRDVSQAYIDQERAINKMSTAMKNQGDYSKAALSDMEDYASEIQNTTTVADDAALKMMANLKTYGMLNDEVKEAAKVAIDFASAKREEGMTVEAASELIGKAYMGQTERLKRYGIVVDQTKSRAEQFNEVMKQLKDRFGGAAAAEMDTYEGKLKNVNNQFGDMKEKIGQVALAFGTAFIPAMKEAITELDKAAEGMQMFFDTTRKGQLMQRRLEIIDQLREVEGKFLEIDQAAAPGLFKRLWDGFFGASTGAERAAMKAADLKAQLVFVGEELRKIEIENNKTQPGGTRFIPIDEDALKKSRADYDKFLKEVESEHEKAQKSLGERESLNQAENLEKMLAEREREEKEAAEDRLKMYRKMGEDEEKVWNVVTKSYKKELDKQQYFTEQSARNMQDAMSDFFFDAISGDLRTFGDYWESFWGSMKRVLSNTFAEMALTWAGSEFKSLITGTGGGSFLGSILPALGTAVSAVSEYATSAFDWATSLFMHEGGLVGKEKGSALGSDEMMAVLQKGEYVIPKDLAARLGLSGPGATPGVTGMAGGTMTGMQALGLFGLAIGGPAAAAAISGGTLAAIAIGLAKGAKGISTILGIQGRQNNIWGYEAPPDTSNLSLQDALDMLGGGSYGGAGSNYGGAGYGGFGAFGGYATGGIVPRDQIAKVHAGEGVFTPEQMDRLSAGSNEIVITIPVYIDGRMVSEAVYEGVYDASRRGAVKLHQRGVQGYAETAGIDI